MVQKQSVLFLSTDPILAASVAGQLKMQNFDVVTAMRPAEAIRELKSRGIDMLIVDAMLAEPSAIDFMEKARQFLPSVLRGMYEPRSMDTDWRDLINRAAPSAVFTGAIDASRIKKIVEKEGKAQYMNGFTCAAQTVSQSSEEKTNGKPTSASFGRPMEAAKFPAAASGGTIKSSVSGSNSAIKSSEASIEADSFSEEPEAELRMNPNAPDPVAEVIRILDTLFDAPEIRLPILPQIALEVQRLTANESSSFEQIAEKVGLDPSMAARILEVANSPIYAGADRIKSVQQAVARIGLRETRSILQVVAAENLFKTRDRKLATTMAMLWMHSLAVAYGNEILTKLLFIPEGEDYFMMGLLHDIGKILIIQLVQQGYQIGVWTPQMITSELLNEVMRRRHNEMGMRLVEKWGYPVPFHDVVRRHNDNDRIQEYDESVVVTYFSNLLSRKLGLSLLDHEPRFLDRHEVAQSLNMSLQTRERVERAMAVTVEKIKASFLPKA